MENAIARFIRNLSYIFSHFILCMLLIAITGCATGEKVTRLSPGMSQADVVGTALGSPFMKGLKTR
jgi:hypothetical protein